MHKLIFLNTFFHPVFLHAYRGGLFELAIVADPFKKS